MIAPIVIVVVKVLADCSFFCQFAAFQIRSNFPARRGGYPLRFPVTAIPLVQFVVVYILFETKKRIISML